MRKFKVLGLAFWMSASGMGAAGAGEPTDLNIFVSLAKKAVPSVVNISTLTTPKGDFNQEIPEEFFRRFFGGGMGNLKPPRAAAALGTGFIVDASGLILTNNHVVAGADQIKIQFTENLDEKATEGKVVGRDPELDVALIQVQTSRKLEPLVMGDSDSLQVGEYVLAVGNPFGNGHSVSHGIVSAKGRMLPGVPLASYLQIDAPINPGNSGGPLLNTKGQVVGINNAIDARAQGIGFAIPINYVKQILKQLQTEGKVERGYIGAVVAPLSSEIGEKMGIPATRQAPFIVQVNSNTPADQAGLKPYDVILEVGGTPVYTPSEVVRAITSAPIGKKIPLKIFREGKEKTVSIQTRVRPSHDLANEEGSEPDRKERFSSASGMSLQDQPPRAGKGVLISSVKQGSPAEEAGLQMGDIIVDIEMEAVTSAKQVAATLQKGKTYLLRIRRGDPSGGGEYAVIFLDLKKSKF